MWAVIFLILYSFLGISEGKDPEFNTSRNALVDDILKKIKKISSESVSNTGSNDKENVIRLIEDKLRKAAEPLGEKGEKYVNLIIRGLRSNKNSKHKQTDELKDTPKETHGENKNDLRNSRNTMIDFIIEKIKKVSDESLNKASNKQEKENVLISIENKLKKLSESQGEKGSKYINLIMKGIRHKNKVNLNDNNSKPEGKRRSAHLLKGGRSDKSRNVMIDYILKKIGKMSLETNLTHNPERHFSSVEEKLRKAAEPLGDKGSKYINLIMRALRSSNKNNRFNDDESMSAEVNDVVNEALKLNNLIKINKDDEILRKQAIERIARAIEMVRDNHPLKSYDEIIENIQRKIYESMKRTNILKNNNEIKLLSDLIVDGINKARKEVVRQDRTHGKLTEYPGNEAEEDILNPSTVKMSSKSKLLCKNTVQRTCANIRNMNILKCSYMDESIPLYKLCNGKYDCPDRSDEKRCAEQATEKVRYAHSVLTALDISLENDCLMTDINEKILSKQNLILRDVLRAQLNFIDKYKTENMSVKYVAKKNENIRPPIKEITDVIGTLTMALDKALCSPKEIKNDHDLRRFNEIFDEDVEVQESSTKTWPPQSCSCRNEHCYNCTSSCRRICWHKASLTHWNCDSVNDTSMVSLNVLCDGKFDCYDESDEKDCFSDNVHGKFEAHKIFTETTDSLKLKASKDYKGARIKVWALINSVSNLEKLSLGTNPNPKTIKENRDNAFALLESVYSEIIKRTTYAYEAEDLYIFLISINQQLVAILKRIGTGNKKIISDSCFCRKGKCAATFCTRRCQKACAVEPKLTRYYCENTISNKSIDIERICDGVPDCPRKDDEKYCSNDICRSHHITVLQHKVQDVGVKQKGTAMGEVLSTWKTKVLATLKVAEKSGRPTQKILKDLVKDILRDLVLTYGSVEEYRRKDNNYAVQDFTNIAASILETLRSCGK